LSAEPMHQFLDERISSSFGDGITSAIVAALIGEVEAAAASSGEAAQHARERALDPALPPPEVAMQRRAMEDAAFQRDRLQVAVERLGERLREVRAREEDQRRRAAYDEARVQRDTLAEELARVYPPLAAQLAAWTRTTN
jgi:hypothetical protein